MRISLSCVLPVLSLASAGFGLANRNGNAMIQAQHTIDLANVKTESSISASETARTALAGTAIVWPTASIANKHTIGSKVQDNDEHKHNIVSLAAAQASSEWVITSTLIPTVSTSSFIKTETVGSVTFRFPRSTLVSSVYTRYLITTVPRAAQSARTRTSTVFVDAPTKASTRTVIVHVPSTTSASRSTPTRTGRRTRTTTLETTLSSTSTVWAISPTKPSSTQTLVVVHDPTTSATSSSTVVYVVTPVVNSTSTIVKTVSTATFVLTPTTTTSSLAPSTSTLWVDPTEPTSTKSSSFSSSVSTIATVTSKTTTATSTVTDDDDDQDDDDEDTDDEEDEDGEDEENDEDDDEEDDEDDDEDDDYFSDTRTSTKPVTRISTRTLSTRTRMRTRTRTKTLSTTSHPPVVVTSTPPVLTTVTSGKRLTHVHKLTSVPRFIPTVSFSTVTFDPLTSESSSAASTEISDDDEWTHTAVPETATVTVYTSESSLTEESTTEALWTNRPWNSTNTRPHTVTATLTRPRSFGSTLTTTGTSTMTWTASRVMTSTTTWTSTRTAGHRMSRKKSSTRSSKSSTLALQPNVYGTSAPAAGANERLNPGTNNRPLGKVKGTLGDKAVAYPNKNGNPDCKALGKKCKVADDQGPVRSCFQVLQEHIYSIHVKHPDITYGTREKIACAPGSSEYCAFIEWEAWTPKGMRHSRVLNEMQQPVVKDGRIPMLAIVEAVNWIKSGGAKLCGQTLLPVAEATVPGNGTAAMQVGRYVLKLDVKAQGLKDVRVDDED